MKDNWTEFVRRTVGPEAVDPLVGVCALIALVLLLSAYAQLPGLTVFGNDEVHYYRDFSFKLPEDGRWLNQFLHDFLRSLPPGTWAGLFLILSWLTFFRLVAAAGCNLGYAALTASTILLAYPFVEQSLWPATTIPAVAILLVAGLLVERGLPYPLLYLLSGILLFGTVQSFYFLLPLLFLGQFLPQPGTANPRWPLILGHMVWWSVGACVGVLVMSAILLQMTGHFGVQPATWRRTQPAHDLSGVVHNILYVAEAFLQRIGQLLREAGANRDGFITILGVAVLLRARTLFGMGPAFLVLTAVMAAFFAFSIPLAPLIGGRSLVAMAAAVVLLIALLPGPSSAAGRGLGALLLLTVSYGFSTHSAAYLARHEAEMRFFHDKFRALVPGDPRGYSAIALFGMMNDGAPEARLFNTPSYMHPVVYALGAREYRDCRQEDSRCNGLVEGVPIATLPFCNGQLLLSVDSNNVAIVRYRE